MRSLPRRATEGTVYELLMAMKEVECVEHSDPLYDSSSRSKYACLWLRKSGDPL